MSTENCILLRNMERPLSFIFLCACQNCVTFNSPFVGNETTTDGDSAQFARIENCSQNWRQRRRLLVISCEAVRCGAGGHHVPLYDSTGVLCIHFEYQNICGAGEESNFHKGSDATLHTQMGKIESYLASWPNIIVVSLLFF